MSSENSSRPAHSFTNNGNGNGKGQSSKHDPQTPDHAEQDDGRAFGPAGHGPQSENGNGYGHHKHGGNGHAFGQDGHGPQNEHGNGYGHDKHGEGKGYGHYDNLSAPDPALALSDTPAYEPDINNLDPFKVWSTADLSFSWIPEDNDNAQHMEGNYSGQTPVSPYGALVTLELKPEPGYDYNDGYLTSVTLTTSGITGSYYNQSGTLLTSGMVIQDAAGNEYTIILSNRNPGAVTINIDSTHSTWKPVDLSQLGLVFRPNAADSDKDIRVSYSITLENELGGDAQLQSNAPIIIDAVADLPDYLGGAESEVTVGPSDDGKLTASETSYDNGVASQTVGGGLGESGSDVVFVLGNVRFHDYTDGSEEHFVLVACNDADAEWSIDVSALGQGDYEAFVAPSGGVLETIWLDANNNKVSADADGATAYHKIVVNDAYLKEHDGKADIKLPVVVGANTESGEYQFDVKAGAEEHPTISRSEKEIDAGNNFAVTDVEAVQVNIRPIESTITVSTGWTYESGSIAGSTDNADADPAGTGVGAGHAGSFSYVGADGWVNGSAAFIKLLPELAPGETLGQWITLTYDASRGDVYLPNGSKVNSSHEGKAFVTIDSATLGSGGMVLYFVPNPENDDDSDLAITYNFSVKVTGADGEIKEFTVTNELPIIIDAVADPADMHLAPSGEAPEFEGFTLDYTAEIRSDGSETQYLVISNPDGLLALGALGPLAAHFTQVGVDELRAFENSDPNIGRHFDDIGANDIILRIEDLDGLDGAADGTVNLKIPFTVTDRTAAGDQLDVAISTVVVEGGGNNAAKWDQTTDKEYDFANNIAVTDDTATVHLARGGMTVTAAGAVYEGDKAEQHLVGDADAPEYGTALNVQFDDPHEAIRDISFTLTTPGGSAVDGAVAFGLGTDYTLVPTGGSLRFTAVEADGEARYTAVQVLDAGGNVIADYAINPASTLQALNASGNASGLRFIPSGDGDADVQVSFTARVTDVRSGDVITVNDSPAIDIIRDAVADRPGAASNIEPSANGHAAVVAGSTVTVNVTATFSDYTDGSEAQYLFVSKDYLASIDIPAALAGALQVLKGAAADQVCAQVDGEGGISDATADGYFVIKVDPNYLQTQGGSLDLPLSATLRTDIAKDGSETLDIKAVTVEYDGFLTGTHVGQDGNNAEPDATNNVAVTNAPAHIAWATLENVFHFSVENPAYENDQPGRHTGDPTLAGGAGIRIAPEDASEVFDTLNITYAGEDGLAASGSMFLVMGNQSLEIPSGTTLHFTYDAANPTHCVGVSYTDAAGTHSLSVPGLTLEQLTAQGLRYVPAASGNDSDSDVQVTFSGATRETETDETGVYGATTVQVIVDAVADKPDGATSPYDYTQYGQDAHGNPYTAVAEGSAVSFQVNTTFHDYADGSETHYLFVNTKYLANGSLVLIDNATGQAFTGGTVVADPTALYAQINGSPGLAPGADDAYVVLEINPAYLAAHGGSLDLTVQGVLKDADALRPLGPEKTPLDLDVKAVAVEHQGYLSNEAGAVSDDNDEYSAANNVAVTDIGTQFQWDALRNKFTATAEAAFEGDQSGQHTGDLTAAGGAALTIAPEDASEVFTGMELDYDNSHGNMVLSADDASGTLHSLILSPNADVTFTFDPADPTRIISVSCNGEMMDVYAADGSRGMTLEALTSGGLRYVPHTGDDDDADVSVTINADTLETTTGATNSTSLTTVVVVDAVADRPQDVSATLQVTSGKGDTVILNEANGIDSFDIAVAATFNEYENNTEGHYIFVSGQYLSSLDGLPTGITQLGDAAATAIISNAGLSGEYFVLEVSDAYLQANGGTVDITLTAHLDGNALPEEDEIVHVDVKAGAIEHQGHNTPVDGTDLGGGHGQDADADNNVSLVDMGIDLHYARLDNAFTVNVGQAHEGDAPDQHIGNNSPAGGATVDFAPTDTSEVFDSLVVDYDDAEGSLYLDLPVLGGGNVRLELPDGAGLTFTYRNEGAGATLCTAVTVTIEGTPTTYALATHIPLRQLTGDGRLHYIPDAGSQSDADVAVTFSGIARETATGETGAFSRVVPIVVDAVADKPDATGDAANQEAGRAALEPGVPFDVTVNADFGDDLQDRSESHYVFISRDYLASLTIPTALAGSVALLSQAEAALVCARVNGSGGIPGANADDYFVFEMNAEWLQTNGGAANLQLKGVLKSPAELGQAGGAEGQNLTLDMKAVAVEHEGFLTSTTGDLGSNHGYDLTATNNVSVDDASATFTYAVVDGGMTAEAAPAYEGDQPGQHTGDVSLAGGAAVTLAPQDKSEVFNDLTLDYDDANGSLALSALDGTAVTLGSGAKLVFSYDPAHPTECLSVQVWQHGDTAPSATLSFADPVTERGLSLTDLTTGHLRYVPTAGDHHDADVAVDFAGTLLETDSGAEGPVNGSLTVVVDAVADRPENATGQAVVMDGTGSRPAALPGETVTITLQAEFKDYGEDDAGDVSESHYVFIAKEHLPTLDGMPVGVDAITNAAALADIFNALAQSGGVGIHAGPGAAADYYVLQVSPEYLRSNGGTLSMTLTTVAGEKGIYPVEAKAVAIEHDGYQTDVDGIGGGADRDVTADNNVAVTDMSFDLVVRVFEPEKVKVELASEWAFENDRSKGNEQYYAPADSGEGRDHGVQLLFEGPGEGYEVSSITFEYNMPSNGSPTPHRIESFVNGAANPNVAITYDTTTHPGKVIVTVTSTDPYGSVGELHFVPGDNYDNADVDITVLNVEVADPLLHMTSDEMPEWGNGVAPDSEDLHVKVDAVAQAPEVDIAGVDHDSGNPVIAGGEIHITGQVSFEDTADGSEQHFILLEMQDGYYPDAVTLEYNGTTVTIPVVHYSSGNPPTPANYTMQQLITADDNLPHLFIKLPVDGALAQLMNGGSYERMDDIALNVTYQTREWAAEGTALHFAAIASEDVEGVREYDADWNITNDELPFDKQLEQYCPGLTVTPNNTAITVQSQGAYVFWDSDDPEDVSFKGFVAENDRPSDHLRDPAYILDRVSATDPVHVENTYPVSPELRPFDPVANTGRDYGTGVELKIPANTTEIRLTENGENHGRGDFYFLPKAVWTAHMTSPAPLSDASLAGYKVPLDGSTVTAAGNDYILVFIPSHEPYDANHDETNDNGSHKDYDFRFDYEILANQYSPDGTLLGAKKFVGEDEVIRVDAVANQAELVQAISADPVKEFSLWNGENTVSSFDLTVNFHDLDGTEDHYILVEMVPNFAFKCGSYIYQPGNPNSISPGDNESIFTHVMTDENGNQTFIRYYKIPVDMADIDPATGQATVQVEFVRQPGMPSVADYPSSQDLTYGALTEDNTSSRWDSYDPTAENFINRKGADGEYSYENNTSVIIRNGIDNGDPNDGEHNPGWWDGSGGGSSGEEPGGGGSGGHIHWENGPGSGWSGGYWPVGGATGGYWRPDGPAGGGDWWKPEGGIGQGSGGIEDWIPAGGGTWGELPGGGGIAGGGGGGAPDGSDSKWIASRGQGLAIEWVFENSTPLGHTQAGQYNAVMPAQIFLTGGNPDAEYVYVTIPGVTSQTILGATNPTLSSTFNPHSRAALALSTGSAVSAVKDPNTGDITYKIHAPGGELPAGQSLFMLVAPDSMGEDFQMQVRWEDAGGNTLSSGPVDVLVDAVAQWANFGFEEGHEDGVYGVTGDNPTELVSVDVNAYFLDQDGSESNYLLVEKLPGVLPLHGDGRGGYDPVREVYLQGKTYFIIEPTEAELRANKVTLQFSVNEELTSPMYVRDDIVHNGQPFTGMQLTIGTMTVEGQIGSAADGSTPANWEYTLDNNTSLNIQEDALTIIISKVNAEGGNNTIMAVETGAPDENLLWLDPTDPANGLNLTMDGNDILTSLIFTAMSGNGSFWYVDENNVHHPVPTGVNMADAYLAGRIYHKQDRYQDADAALEWTADLKDGVTENSQVTVTGKLTVAVDAVAKAEEIHLAFPVLDTAAGALTQTLTFDDHQSNEQHYAVIAPDLYRVVGKQAQVQGPDGGWHTVNVETIFDPDGNPYYAVLLDGWLDANGSATVQFEMHELNIPGIENFPVISGGVSIEPNAGYFPEDRELNLADNWVINTEAKFVNQGVVGSRNLAFSAVEIVEDDAAGAPIAFTGEIGGNDTILSAVLTFTPKATAGARAADAASFAGDAGDQIATIVYDGRCFAVTLDGAGNASADVSFGDGGFDPTADFRIIWGVAHMEDGVLVVDSWNHDADGRLDLNTVFTVQNDLSGQTQTLSGADPDGIALTARADAALDVSGQTTAINDQPATPTDPAGAGEDTLTVTLSGRFVDLDGSESHYLLLEIPEGWQVVDPSGGTFQTVNGLRYYRVEVDGGEAAPTVDVALRSPDALNSDVNLKTGAQAVEGNGDSLFTQGADVTLHLSDVSATSLDATVSPILEDGPLSLAALADAVLVNGDGNDTLLSVTFTDLKGGSIVDADGDPVSGLTFTKAELASGRYFYKPAADYAGELDAQGRPLPIVLGYDAQLGETDTGASATLTGQSLSVTVTPVADAPENLNGHSDTTTLEEVQTGHKAPVSVTLQAAFADVDGSEEHFFVVRAPDGVTVQSGAGYTFTLLAAADLAALGLPADFPTDGLLYKVTLNDNTQASASLSLNLEVITTVYNGGRLDVVGGASELRQDGSYSYACSDTQAVVLPPAVEHSIGNADPVPVAGGATLDSLRAVSVSGSLDMHDVDPDGDSVSTGGLSFGGTQGTRDTVDGRECYTVQGNHGTLYLFDDGTYRYDLAAGQEGVATQEVFDYQLADGYGGTGESTITITLTDNNTAPAATTVEAQLDSVRQTAVTDHLVFQDADGDAVTVAGVNGNTTLQNLGTEAEPIWGFEVAGNYGTLQVRQDADGRWQYSYALDAAHKGQEEDEHFTLTLRDAYGLETEGSIDIDLYNVNAAPVAGQGTATLDTLRDADKATSGSVALSDADNDPVTLNAVTGPNDVAGAWGVDDKGDAAFVVQGRYGTLYLYQSGGTALQYRYVLTNAQAGGLDATEAFTYAVDDGYLGTASGSITINLSNANNAPEITGDLSGELDTLRSATGQTGGALAFHDPDYNPDMGRSDLVTLSGVSFNGASGTADEQGGFTVNGAHGVFRIEASGAYTYTLNADSAGALGVENFTVTLTDEFGATRSETVAIDLVVHNQNPTASSGSISLNTWRDGGRASGSVTLLDADGDTVTVDTVTGVSAGVWGEDQDGNPAFVVQGEYGLLYLHADGTYKYVLDEVSQGASGTDAFAFTVRDGFGGSASNTININLSDANAAPVLSGDLSTAIGGSIEDYEGGLVRESGQIAWSDADGDDIGSVTVGGVTLPSSGEVSIEGLYGALLVTTDGGSNASWVYTMKPGLDTQGINDVDSFDIVVKDIYGGEASRALDVSLAPLSHAPECDDLNITWPKTPTGTPVSFITGDLPFSDVDLGYDPQESLQLTVNDAAVSGEVTVQGQYGSLTINSDGLFTYTTTCIDQDLLEDFTYTVTDNAGNSATAHLYIRLSDTAPDFPNTGAVQSAALFEESPVLAPDDAPVEPTAADAPAMDDAPAGEPQDALPDPVEVDLFSVPLPYDVEPGTALCA